MKGNLIRTTLALLVTASAVKAQSISVAGLPLYNKAALQSKEDWLLDPTARKSAIYRTPEGYMALSNGLITRTFTLTPNGATIGLDNLVTNEALVRAVSPEATLWINGHEIKAGGLTGQPIGNYLLPKWIPEMKADPLSLKLTSYTTAPIKARFEWNRRSAWSPQQLPWPPKGMEVTFNYQADATIMSGLSSDISRKVLFTDNFLSLSPKWEIIKGAASQNASFQNEGKAGEMQTAANSVLFAEQALSSETKVIICKLNSGTDESNGYGSGIALQFPDGRSSKFHLAPAAKRFRVFHDNKSANFEGYDPGKSYFLRILFLPGRMAFSVSEDGKTYTTLTELPVANQPTHVRIGKTDPQGGRSERGEAGAKGRSKIEAVLILGAPDAVQQDLQFLSGLTVKVHYEIYDGIPLLSKWVSVSNNSKEQIIINNIKSEQLAVTEAESAVEHKQRWEMPPILAESDFAFGSMSSNAAQNACVDWQTDPSYTTQVNYNLKTPSVLVCMPKTGMGQEVAAGASTESARIWELIFDSYDRERRGLSQKKLYRTIAPWVTENPIIMHVSSAADEPVKSAIDQSAEVGFEMVIMTFGSGFNIEDTTQQNVQRMKQLKQYAASKGVALGGYSLLASRSINKENDVVMPEGMKPAFGNSPCLQSEWGQNYFRKLYNFYEKTGQDLLEHDGSYPGDVCGSTAHPGHRNLEDSRWKQYKTIQQFYQWCRGKGIYLNIPDWYFLSGGTKVAMGYRETNWSLPREQQEIIERQNIYDGTWEKTPSMGWMFVPLVQYHGGGAAATIEPLKEHLPHYEQRLANLFGAGVQACYRGPRLYDAPETKVLVKKWVDFYKKYRRVLDGDLIHLRRPDGRDYDGILHVDPQGKDKGLVMIYNPLTEPITRNIEVDLYYTGLKNQASIIGENGIAKKVTLKGTKLNLQVTIPANSQQWFALRQ